MYYSKSKIRSDLTRLDEFRSRDSHSTGWHQTSPKITMRRLRGVFVALCRFHAFIYEGWHQTSPQITTSRLRVHFLRISKQV